MAGKEKWSELLQSFPCLWDPHDPDFSNEAVKKASRERLLAICNLQSSVPVDMESLKQWLSDNVVTTEFQGVSGLVQPSQHNPTLEESGVQQQNITPDLKDLVLEYPCLWDLKDPNYKNFSMRERCKRQLLAKCNSLSPTVITMCTLRRELASLCSQMRRRKKISRTAKEKRSAVASQNGHSVPVAVPAAPPSSELPQQIISPCGPELPQIISPLRSELPQQIISPPRSELPQQIISPPKSELPQQIISPPGRGLPQQIISPPGSELQQIISSPGKDLPQRIISPPGNGLPQQVISPPVSELPQQVISPPGIELAQQTIGPPRRGQPQQVISPPVSVLPQQIISPAGSGLPQQVISAPGSELSQQIISPPVAVQRKLVISVLWRQPPQNIISTGTDLPHQIISPPGKELPQQIINQSVSKLPQQIIRPPGTQLPQVISPPGIGQPQEIIDLTSGMELPQQIIRPPGTQLPQVISPPGIGQPQEIIDLTSGTDLPQPIIRPPGTELAQIVSPTSGLTSVPTQRIPIVTEESVPITLQDDTPEICDVLPRVTTPEIPRLVPMAETENDQNLPKKAKKELPNSKRPKRPTSNEKKQLENPTLSTLAKEFACLWHPGHPHYGLGAVRNLSLQLLLLKYNEIYPEKLTLRQLRRRIRNRARTIYNNMTKNQAPKDQQRNIQNANEENHHPPSDDLALEISSDSDEPLSNYTREEPQNQETTEISGPTTEVTNPTTEITVPNTDITVPDTEITVPNTETAVPETGITVPGKEITVPDTKTTVPETDKTVPDTKITVSNTDITVPDTKTTVPDTEKTVPDTRITVPDKEITVPDTKTTVPDTEKTVPDTEMKVTDMEITMSITEIKPANETPELKTDAAVPENDINSLKEIEENKTNSQKSQSAPKKGEKSTMVTLFQEFPCLWDPEHPHFGFGAVKALSLQLLLAKYNNVFPKKITQTQLKKKMMNIAKKKRTGKATILDAQNGMVRKKSSEKRAGKIVKCVTRISKKLDYPKDQGSNIQARTEENLQPPPDRLAFFAISSDSTDSDEPLSNYKHRRPQNQGTTAPYADITVPNTEISVPNTEISVPNTEINVHNTGITPLNTEINVRNTGITVPDTKITVPNTGITIPHTGIIVPNTGLILPNTEITVPNTGITIPHTGIIVPNTAFTISYTGITVPPTEITLPNTGITDPTNEITAPNTGITVPNMEITVPNTGITVPNTGINAPNTGINVPNTRITVPDTVITIPNAGTTVPNTGIPILSARNTVPNTGITIPNARTTVPNTGIPIPSARNTVPNTGITIPNARTTVPNTGIPIPSARNTVPNTGIPIPSARNTVPNTGITIPNARTTVPNTGIPIPSARNTVPNTGITIPNARTTVPNTGIPFPSARNTVPNTGITNPDAVIDFNWCRFCGQLKNDCTDVFQKHRTYISLTHDCGVHVNKLWFYVVFNHETLPNNICGDCDKTLSDINAFVTRVRKVQETFIILENERLKRKRESADNTESKDGSGGKKFRITIDLNPDTLPPLSGDEDDCDCEINCNDETDSLTETDVAAKDNCEVIDLSDDDIEMKPENEARPLLSNDTELTNEISESNRILNDISFQSQCVYETNDNIINCKVRTNSLSVTGPDLVNEVVKHDSKYVVPVNITSQSPCVNGNRWVEVGPIAENDGEVNNEESERNGISDCDSPQSCVDENNDDSLSATDTIGNEVVQPNNSKVLVDMMSKNIVSYKINGEDFRGICTDKGSHTNKVSVPTDLNSHSPLEDDANGAVSKYRHLLLDSLSLNTEQNNVVAVDGKSQLSSCNDDDLNILNNVVETKYKLLVDSHPLNTKSRKISEQNDKRVVSVDVKPHLRPSNNDDNRNNDIESKHRHLLDSLAVFSESAKVTDEKNYCVDSDVDVKPYLTPSNNEVNRHDYSESKYRHLLLGSLANTESAKVTEEKNDCVASTDVKPDLSPLCNTENRNYDVESKYKRLLLDSLSANAESAEVNKQKNERGAFVQTSPSNKDDDGNNGLGRHENETDSNDADSYEKFIKEVLLQAIDSAGMTIKKSGESIKSIKCVDTGTIVDVKKEIDDDITDKEI